MLQERWIMLHSNYLLHRNELHMHYADNTKDTMVTRVYMGTSFIKWQLVQEILGKNFEKENKNKNMYLKV